MIPYHVILELTNSCNLNCIQCYASTYSRNFSLKFLEIKNLFYELKKLGTQQITLTGGEPVLHKDFIKIIDLSNKNDFKLCIRTNGFFWRENLINKLSNYPNIKWIIVGLNGLKNSHEKITRTKNSFEKSVNTIKVLKKRNIEVLVSVTLLKLNLNDMWNYIDMVRDFGVDNIVFSTLLKIGRGVDIANLKLTLNEFESVIKIFKEKGFNLKQVINSKAELSPLNLILKHSFCGVGSSSCTILADGSIVPCPLFRDRKFVAGDIKDGFEEIWENSSVLKQFRLNEINSFEKCSDCKFKKSCLGGCRAQAYQYFGSITSPDPESCIIFKAYEES